VPDHAALETQSGLVLGTSVATPVVAGFEVSIDGRFSGVHRGGKTAERHTSDEFVAFLEQIVNSQPATRRRLARPL